MSSSPLVVAALTPDLNEISRLVKAGRRDPNAFLSDLGFTISYDPPEDEKEMMALAERQAGRSVRNEYEYLFEIYKALLEAGHPIPDDHSRRCLVRVISGAAKERAVDAVDMMEICINQGMLNWQTSEWANERAKNHQPGDTFASLIQTPHELFQDALGIAAETGNLAMVNLLVSQLPNNPIDKTVMLSRATRSAAERCAIGGSIECMRVLLEVLNEKDWRNTSIQVAQPLVIRAAQSGHEHMVKWLVERGHDINEPTADGNGNILVAAIESKQANIIPVLLDLGASPNLNKENAPGPLHMAVWHNLNTVIEDLIKAGDDIDRQANDGWTPTFIAGMTGNHIGLDMLIKAGADIEISDKDGNTPMAVACRNDRYDAYCLLRTAGASLDTSNNEGATPRQLAKGRVLAAIENEAIEKATSMATGRAKPAPRI